MFDIWYLSSNNPTMKKFILLAVLVISACTTITQNNGAEIRQVKLDEIGPSSTKPQIYELLGSPSTKSIYGDETWFYITSQIRRELIKSDKILKQNVIAITFDKANHVSNIEVYDINDRRDFANESDTTPTAGKPLTVMEQLLGNVGKFNKEGGDNPIGSHAPSGGTRPY